MIVIGYQGIGKSTLANKENGYIDLESSCFFHDGFRSEDWYIYYCQIAEHLSSHGYVVFVSSHAAVQKQLRYSGEPVIIVYPAISIKDEWNKKLYARYKNCPSDKNYKAWRNSEEMFEENINAFEYSGYACFQIDVMDYDLVKLIKTGSYLYPDVIPYRSIRKVL